MRQRLKALLRAAGWSVGRYDRRSDPAAARKTLFAAMGIDVVLDVGANSGQFARQMRGEGYAGRIISFEPLSTAYEQLAAAATGEPSWEIHQCALGNTVGTAKLNIAGNSWSSSSRCQWEIAVSPRDQHK